MRDYTKIFKEKQENDEAMYIEEALACLDQFGASFEKEDIEGMDACCHFPHYLLSGSEVICWQRAGQITKDFFEKLKEKDLKELL